MHSETQNKTAYNKILSVIGRGFSLRKSLCCGSIEMNHCMRVNGRLLYIVGSKLYGGAAKGSNFHSFLMLTSPNIVFEVQ